MKFLSFGFNSILGNVNSNDILNSLWLMIKGMVGIFIVMFLIYVIIVLINKIPSNNMYKNQKDKDKVEK